MKRLLALAITLILLALLVAKVDPDALQKNLARTHWGWFSAAILLFVPQLITIAWRWKRLVSVFTSITVAESLRLIFASQAMNLVLPSKMGDLSKGYFLSRGGALDLKHAMNIVIFEKMLDVAVLAIFMLGGVAALLSYGQLSELRTHSAWAAGAIGTIAVLAVSILYFVPVRCLPGLGSLLRWMADKPKLRRFHALADSSQQVIGMLQERGSRRSEIVALSVLIWSWHLIQIYCFFRAVGATPHPREFLALVPLAIFIGLLPLTISGFGTRDAAIVLLFPAFPRATMLAAAFYINLRYLLPAAVGIPLLRRYAFRRT